MDEHNLSGYRNSFNTHLNRVPLPFAFPFAPLGLGLFDTDPSRILSLLHHQTLLAEEALRYRGVFLNPKETMRYNPLAEMLAAKDQDNRRRHQLPTQRDPFRLHHGIPDLIPASTVKQQLYNDEVLSKRMQCDTQDIYSVDESRTPSRDSNQSLTSKDIIDEILSKRGGSYLKEGIRFNPFSLSKDKSINPTSTSCSSPSAKTIADSVLLQESALSNEDETKCTICNASFPSMWLLEQHQALQHSSGTGEEKNFMSDSFRSAFAKHRDQSQRSRLPADKLFTCDVCGMQFRYLKSFKKHRLNHALERIHGKKNSENNNEMVTSSNESVEDNIDLNGMIKDEEEEEEDDNEMIDSMSRDDQPIPASSDSSIHSKITSSDMEITSQITGPAVGGSGIGSIKVKAPSFLQKYDVESSMPTTSMSHLLRPDTTIGLNPQETSLLNYLRADAADKQRERGTSASRFACPFCGKCVRSKENLKLHVRKHTGERPFVCLFCGRAFGGKSDLTRHLRIHTGERPYHCEACGKCFARADYLSKHLTTHLHNTSR